MVRIKIDWETVSPLLQTISGIVIIEDVNFNTDDLDSKEILKCSVHSSNTPRCTGFNSINGKGYSNKIFKKYKNTIDVMVDSYLRGVTLKQLDFVWVDE